MKREELVDVSNLLQIKDEFLNRNKNLMYGLLKFLIGPLLVAITMQDSTQRTFRNEITGYIVWILAIAFTLYVATSLVGDLVLYFKPLKKVTLSARQKQLLDWPANYPEDLIETPTMSVLEQEQQKTRGNQSSPRPSSSPAPSSSPFPSAPTSPYTTTTNATTPSQPMQPVPSYTQPPAYTPQTPAQPTPSTSFVSSLFPSPFRTPQPTPQPPLTPTPVPSPFTLSTIGTPAPSQYPQTPYTFASPQQTYTPQPQTFASPSAHTFASPSPSTTYSSSAFLATPQTSASPYTLAATSASSNQPLAYGSPISSTGSPSVSSPVPSPSSQAANMASFRRSRFAFATPDLATEHSLRKYVEHARLEADKRASHASTRAYSSSSIFSSTNTPSMQLPRYRASYDGAPRTQTPQQEIPQLEEDLYAYQANALQMLPQEGVHGMDDYIERLQEWLGLRLLPYVMLFVNLYLNREVPANQQQWNTFKPHIQEYLDMSAHGFTQANSADYVANRVKELQQGALISKYNWSRGSEGQVGGALAWDTRYPCDAQLILHLFCTFLDLHLLQDPTRLGGKPFTSKYFSRLAFSPAKFAHPVIVQKTTYPPHFELVLPDRIWPIQQGYNNLYHTLVCFIFYVTKNNNGYLGPISIADSEIKLSWVVEDAK